MSVVVGIAGAMRNASVALCDTGRLVAACEVERLTRARRAGLQRCQLPLETIDTVLRLGGRAREEISACAVAEEGIQFPSSFRVERLDHHHGHAATSFLTSPFDEALVLVCDRHGLPDLTVWRGDRDGLRRLEFPWIGPGFATTYSRAAEGMGFAREGEEHRLEALARVARGSDYAVQSMIALRDDRLEVSPHFMASIASMVSSNHSEGSVARFASVAEGVQTHLGQLLLDVIRQIHHSFGGANLCLGGGLFFNSYFNTLVQQSGIYERTFVPVSPGDAGVAVGAALAVAGEEARSARTGPLSPFLGPAFQDDEIKAILENCKLSYSYLYEGQLIEQTVAALAEGQLVGWFQGRMEWGPRALGNRSILASPVAPYVLDNLNRFLKQREPYRSYGVSVREADAARFFLGPSASPFMEYDYEVIEPDTFRTFLPLNADRLRVHTVRESGGRFETLIKAFGAVTGVPILVNTSFNGFNEPIVCTPRDAVRVFYGTGLDMAVIGNFLLRK